MSLQYQRLLVFGASIACSAVTLAAVDIPVLSDDFEDGVLDAASWQVDASAPDSGVIEQNGQAELTNRALLSSVVPVEITNGAVRIEGRFVFAVGEPNDLFTIHTRSSGIADSSDFYRPTLGIAFTVSFSGRVGIGVERPGNSEDEDLGSVIVGIDAGDVYEFVVTDNGFDVSVEISEVGGDGDYAYIEAQSVSLGGGFVSFSSREQVGGDYICSLEEVSIEQELGAMQWKGAEGGNNNFYEAFMEPGGIIWTDANLAAESVGGHLVTLTSAAENDWVYDNLASLQEFWNPGTGPWIGATDFSGGEWVTGEIWDFENWNPGEPNNGGEQYVHFHNTAGDSPSNGWNDASLTGPGAAIVKSYIVEYPNIDCQADVNQDGSVDVNDISAVLFRLGLEPGDFGYEPTADANQDGAIDVNDISFVLFRLGLSC